MRFRKVQFRALAAALVMAGAALPVRAEYPERPITMIVPLAAGGGTDISARMVASYLEKEIGGRIVVVNKTGAAGEIGLTEVATAKPDGYTLGIINTPGIISIPIERSTRFTIDSFDFLAATTYDPGTISVHRDSPIKSIQDFVAEAKKRPGQLTVGTQGVGSAAHIALLFLEQAAGISLKPVPFTGSATARNALLSREVEAVGVNFGEALAFSQGTPWRTLGVMSSERNPLDASIPTFAEAGLKIETGSLRGFAGPKGMPKDVVQKLTEGLRRVAANPAFIEASKKTFQPPLYVEGEDYLRMLRVTDQQLRELWKTKPWNQ